MKPISMTFLFISTLALTSGKVSHHATTSVDQMIKDWQRAKLYTKDYINAMPEDGFGLKPTPEIRSFAQQYLHIAAVNYRYAAAATGRTNPYPGDSLEHMVDMQAKAAVTDVTMKSYDFVIDALKSLMEANMNQKAMLYRFDLTKEEIFLKGFEHQTHHRGQTTVYLRLRGITPPFERLF
jgi:uncharacterized damage-inducible protein DinB